jgi:hypothetical protein
MYTDEQLEPFTIRDVRCACTVCGAHVIGWEGHELSGWCGVCGSYELRMLPVLHGEEAAALSTASAAPRRAARRERDPRAGVVTS